MGTPLFEQLGTYPIEQSQRKSEGDARVLEGAGSWQSWLRNWTGPAGRIGNSSNFACPPLWLSAYPSTLTDIPSTLALASSSVTVTLALPPRCCPGTVLHAVAASGATELWGSGVGRTEWLCECLLYARVSRFERTMKINLNQQGHDHSLKVYPCRSTTVHLRRLVAANQRPHLKSSPAWSRGCEAEPGPSSGQEESPGSNEAPLSFDDEDD
ncbi:hypothetical protein Cgig2_028273 [Carnegiea gigantea]|uniref:Uncharacterized protein n=1 Tax=Carnegiea gigantea TaxID=171969 RepID=A0A9Q1GKQ7_9CARY|nr:hypothetical protein Cgig2_028273 [Carnegiea gigantea]